MFNKSRLRKYTEEIQLRKNSCKERKVATLISAAHIKQKFCVVCVADKNDKRALYIVSSKSCQPNRNFGVENKLKNFRKIFHQAPIDIICVDETKHDSSYPDSQFHIDGIQFPPFRRDRNNY